ncbi:hypothetical protein LshimejAT787_1500850 [Lyophyllum shimeji]|uniref:Uncharacterized protein n=1 Tax=Lyophyllum shimeji TaxID=47721 RepID=A0A9P3UV86_LYOSH|nr:hypothetical protein LshimejAT787_1500850 [Lyophyllum shimeji]
MRRSYFKTRTMIHGKWRRKSLLIFFPSGPSSYELEESVTRFWFAGHVMCPNEVGLDHVITVVITGVFNTFFHPSHCPVANFPFAASLTAPSIFSTSPSRTRPDKTHRSGIETPGCTHFFVNARIMGLFAAFHAIPQATNTQGCAGSKK